MASLRASYDGAVSSSAPVARRSLLPAAVLWDMDGTIIDTEPYWMAAERALVQEAGGTWSHEQALQLVGNPLLVSAQTIIDQTPVTGTAEAVVDLIQGRVESLMRERLPWRPGARELLADLRARGVPCALVTMSYDVLARVLIASLPEGTFAHVVTGDQVAQGKPHPEPYLTAAARLRVDPRRCVAIEDSPTGVASAVAARVPTIGVPHMVPIEPRPGLKLVRTLEQLSADQLLPLAMEGVSGPPVLNPVQASEGTRGSRRTDDQPWWRRAWAVIIAPFTDHHEGERHSRDRSPQRRTVPPPLGRPLEPWGRLERHFQIRWDASDLEAVSELLRRAGVSEHADGSKVYSGLAALVHDPGRPKEKRAIAVFVDGTHLGYLDRKRAQDYFREVKEAAGRGGYVESTATVRVTPQDKRVKLRIHLDLPKPGELLPRNAAPTEPHAIVPLGRRVQVLGEEASSESLQAFVTRSKLTPVLVALRTVVEQTSRSQTCLVEVELDGQVVGQLSRAQSSRLLTVLERLSAQGFLAMARAWVGGTPKAPVVTLDINRDDAHLHDWLALHQGSSRSGSLREVVPGADPISRDD